MKFNSQKLHWPALAVILSTLACRPVITVGWWEMALIGGLILLLAAPLLIRILRFFSRMDSQSRSDSDSGGEIQQD